MGMRVMGKCQSYRLIILNNSSDICGNNWTSAYVTIRRSNGKTTISNPITIYLSTSKKNLIFYSIIFAFFSFMAVLEDAMNIPLFGLFLLALLTMCLDALSCVTVNIS
jgi:hypothetical protein